MPRVRRPKLDWRKIVVELLGSKCARCGATEHLHRDHIVALKNGGLHTASNLQLLCRYCHAHKTTYEDHLGSAWRASKLTKQQMLEIRQAKIVPHGAWCTQRSRPEGFVGYRELAARYGVSSARIWQIRNRVKCKNFSCENILRATTGAS